MKICPNCHAEFQDHVTECVPCQRVLIAPEEKPAFQSLVLDAKALSEEEVGIITEGALPSCREVEQVLRQGGLSTALLPAETHPTDAAATVGSTTLSRYALFIRLADFSTALKLLERQFSHLVAKEGQGRFMVEAVNLESEQVCCPACGETGALEDGACPSCGLYLGIPGEAAD